MPKKLCFRSGNYNGHIFLRNAENNDEIPPQIGKICVFIDAVECRQVMVCLCLYIKTIKFTKLPTDFF